MIWTRMLAALALALAGLAAGGAAAQGLDSVWVQIEARPGLAGAEERARAWDSRLPDVEGYRLRSGWFAVALGPYGREEAAGTLLRLRAAGAIPSDSFLADRSSYVEQFWPPLGLRAALPVPDTAEVVVLPPSAAASVPDETPSEARAAERRLTREERQEVQEALEALGFYSGAIDADFGPGTRRAMAAWQEANGVEPTGIMTTRQRRGMLDGLREVYASLDLSPVENNVVGVAIEMPAGAVEFAGYEAPFAKYEGDEVQVLLISQSGDRDTLAALYEVMQTLEIVPLEGPREIGRDSFRLTGANATRVTSVYATLSDGAVKGFALVWPAGDELRRRIAFQRMLASFRPIDGAVLPDDAGAEAGAEQRRDLLAGLAIRRPEVSGSGFFVAGTGALVTASDIVDSCGRITVGGDIEADLAAIDPALGLALLRPREPLAPLGVGRLAAGLPRLETEVAVAGYSFGGALGGATITYGTLEDSRGLGGEEALVRLAVAAEPGDAGGPVLDADGGVLGLLLPRQETGRSLPPEVQMAADAASLRRFLAEHGVEPPEAGAAGPLDPEDLARRGADMTVLVECWN